MTAAALREMALRHNWSTDFLSLNDPRGEHSLEAAEHASPILRLRAREIPLPSIRS